MRRFAIAFVLLMLAGALLSQTTNTSFINPHWQMPSLLNPNKLQVNHSASFTAGGSSNGQGFYQSMYTNHMLYRFNPKLDLRVNLNFVNFGTATMHGGLDIEGNDDNATKMLPEFELQWRPTENTTLRIEYSQMPHRLGSPYPLSYWPDR